MNSKITIEVDFENGNEPVIQIMFRRSDDIRDNLIQAFLQRFGHQSSWAKIVWAQQYREGPEAGHFDRVFISAISPEELQKESDIISKQIYVAQL